MFRKIATILLLTFLFFNWVGYWLFISWFESRETAAWISRLDSNQYDTSELTSFKIRADVLPYSNASPVFERTDGELEVGNIHYRCVQKRLYNDSLEFLCIPDKEAGRLCLAKKEIVHLAAGVPDSPGHPGHGKPLGKLSPHQLKAFYQSAPAFCICNFFARERMPAAGQAPHLCPGYTRTGWQPPRRTIVRSDSHPLFSI